ncbi:SGNH/GDSL hydrolase family protein [Sphingomonas piscis]|uniref:SGNH/GDSL hydrolase family protein n=1 Tax=Sphingomonas piscis TaxID=2714943 RepID=A0A6G7YSC8_9SPHN|nr:SGNH/GDSL hydrolase family protein [Sphingomonas piscis]QIK79647.1 SGNH/GDSL hydrolase family protein [Sphingomonas piscis]
MVRRAIRAAAITIAAGTVLGASPPSTLPLLVGGRTLTEPDGSLSFGWPGTYFESRFEGSAVRLRLHTSTEHMRLLVDGQQKAVLEKPGVADLTLSGLGDGAHVVRLEKLTESQTGGGRFLGFSLPDGGRVLSPRPKARRIEFIGDSYTVGYGNRSTKRECTRDEVHDLTDTQQAFGPLAAKRLDADYRINAYSGFGIVRNYNGSSPGLSLPIIYPRAKPDVPSAAAAKDDWSPQLIVINLGTNDFSTPLHVGERWKSDADLRTDYRARYEGFVRGLHARHPNAKFLLMGSDAFILDVRQVAGRLSQLPGLTIATVQFGDLDRMGCDWHPSLADHRKLTELVETEVAALRPW